MALRSGIGAADARESARFEAARQALDTRRPSPAVRVWSLWWRCCCRILTMPANRSQLVSSFESKTSAVLVWSLWRRFLVATLLC